MPTFSYTCKDQNAQTVTGKIDASELGLVVDELRRRQLVIISIDEAKAAVSFLTAKGPGPSGHAVKTEDVILFTRQMATMVDAGIPILQTMEALEEQASNLSFKKILAGIHEDIRLGSSLSGAFTKYPRVFNNLFVNMIKVGETAGVLTTEQIENNNIFGYYGYTHRGGQTFKIGDRFFQEDYEPKKEDYTKEEWEEFEIKFQKSLDNSEDDLERNWMKKSGISYVIPFKMRGPKVIETWGEAREAAINMSSYLS